MEMIINKLVVTLEAQFDYEEIVANVKMPKTDIKYNLEVYIENLEKAGKLTNCNYFRAKYLDEKSNQMLMCFIYRGECFRTMQLWKLMGICLASDWSEESEENGIIQTWLRTKIDNLAKGVDWVKEYRVKERQREIAREKMLQEESKDWYSYSAEIKDLLKNYKKYKMRAETGNKEDIKIVEIADKIDFLDDCIDNLEEKDKEIMNAKYKQCVSIRDLAVKLFYSKSSLQREIAHSLDIIEQCFIDRYGK